MKILKVIWITLLLIGVFLTAGCWDQNLLKDKSLIKGVGFELSEEGRIVTSIIVPPEDESDPLQEVIVSLADTPRETRINMDRKSHESLDASKNRIVIFSEEIASGGIFPILDIFYRDPKSALNARVAVSRSKPKELFSMQLKGGKSISEYLIGLLESAEELSFTPEYNLQLICPLLLDPGQDFVLPILDSGKDEVVVKGLALFDGMFMKGELNSTEGIMFTLLSDQMGKLVSLTTRLYQDKKPEAANFITYMVREMNRTLDIGFEPNGLPKVNLDLTIKIAIFEYPEDNLDDRKENIKINELLSEELTLLSKKVVEKLQLANCDALGIGRRLMAFHLDRYQNYDWLEIYPNIKIDPKVKVEVIRHGIIN